MGGEIEKMEVVSYLLVYIAFWDCRNIYLPLGLLGLLQDLIFRPMAIRERGAL